MPDIEDYVDHLGETRKLGYVAPFGDGLKPRGARTNIQKIRTDAGLPALIPQDQWTEVDYVTGYPLTLITDQGQMGSCTAWSDVGGGARQRYIRTGEVLIPSGYFVYDSICGGRDAGSNIIDSMTLMESIGAPPIAAYPKCVLPRNPPSPPAGAPMYKEDVAITLSDAQECATALLMGMFPQVPIQVTNSFENWTADGVAWGGVAPRSRSSNHSIYLGGLKKIGTTWYFRLINSWRASWGPYKNGTCLIPLAAVDNPATEDDGYAHSSTPSPASTVPGASA